ncbi:MAG: hypothetical protein AABW99_04075 [archaeon]
MKKPSKKDPIFEFEKYFRDLETRLKIKGDKTMRRVHFGRFRVFCKLIIEGFNRASAAEKQALAENLFAEARKLEIPLPEFPRQVQANIKSAAREIRTRRALDKKANPRNRKKLL